MGGRKFKGELTNRPQFSTLEKVFPYGSFHISLLGILTSVPIIDEALAFNVQAVLRGEEAFTSIVIKKGGLSTGDVVALYMCKHKNTIFDVEVFTDSKMVTSIKLPDFNSVKWRKASTQLDINLLTWQAIDVTTTFGTPTIAFGIEAGYDTTSGSFTRSHERDSIRASFSHHLSMLRRSAVVGEIIRRFSSDEITFAVGGCFAIDHLIVAKV